MRTAHIAALCFLVAISMVFLGVWQTGLTRAQNACDLDCLSNKIEALNKRVFALEQKSGLVKSTLVGSAKTTKLKETFVNLSGGNMVASDWTKLVGTEFWLDTGLYGSVVTVSWQGWIDNGQGQARLYDATNNRAVDGSEVNVAGDGRTSFYSSAMAIWRGQNQYYIQVKSLQSGVVVISSPRLRILSK